MADLNFHLHLRVPEGRMMIPELLAVVLPGRPHSPGNHRQMSRRLLAQAAVEYDRGGPLRASEKVWGGSKTPAVSTLHLVFKRLDREAFEAALQAWAQEELGDRAQAVAIDGKSLRGIHGEELPGVHLVALYGQQLGLTLAQKGGRGEGSGVERGAGTVGPG